MLPTKPLGPLSRSPASVPTFYITHQQWIIQEQYSLSLDPSVCSYRSDHWSSHDPLPRVVRCR